MNTDSLLFLIELLKSNTVGEEKKLSELYKRAINDNDEYIKLKYSLDNNLFFGVTGRNLLNDGNTYLKKINDSPDNIMELVDEIRQFNELIESDIVKGKTKIEYPGGFFEDVSIVEKTKIEAYDLFFTQLASAITYFVAVEEGFEGLNSLFWQDDKSLLDKIHSINNTFLPKLMNTTNNMQPWVIYKTINDKIIKFCPYEYHTKYISSDNFRDLINRNDYIEYAPLKYYNERLFQDDVVDVPIYCGIGNFVSTSPLESLSLLQSGVVTTPRNPNETMTKVKAPLLGELMKLISYRAASIFTPQNITSVLNQWDNSYYIQLNKKNHKCLLCGELVDNGLVCGTHFSFYRR